MRAGYRLVVTVCIAGVAQIAIAQSEHRRVGPAADGGTVVSTQQLVRPLGESIEIAGRPVALALSPDGKTLAAKDDRDLILVDTSTWKVISEQKLDGGTSPIGICFSGDGKHVFVTSSSDDLHEYAIDDSGTPKRARSIKLPGPGGKGKSFPCGVALSKGGATAVVCLSLNNTLAVVNLADTAIARQIDVGIAPYQVALSPDEKLAYVSCWGGRRAREGERSAPSAGTPVAVDERGIATTGGLCVVDLEAGKLVAEIDTGLSAGDLAISSDGSCLYVANANSDTVSVIDTAARKITEQITVRPDANLPFGSMPCGVALSPDGKQLAVTCAGNNAIAVIDLAAPSDAAKSTIAAWLPTGWYPASVAWRGDRLFVANVKGIGSRKPRQEDGAFNTHQHTGTLQRLTLPPAGEWKRWTDQVLADARVPQVLAARERRQRAEQVKPRPVPQQPGEPSTIEHVVYVIKENRTYDQVFGDFSRANGEPKLCTFGRDVTPNQHALAERYVLLDNYYCNGVLSADGHSWATEGNVTPYLERAFGGFNRSYTFGDDPLTYSSSGFVWDHVLAAGRSFRNYGEFNYAEFTVPPGTPKSWATVYEDWRSKARKVTFQHKIGVERVLRYSNTDYPGWNMSISDQIRADVFLADLAKFEQSGTMPNFITMYLPQDHTSGVKEDTPTPRACVADNDLALGRIVEALSHSRFWPKLVLFAIEDDPQNGWDHVDGHRSTCLVVGPYVRRGAIVSEFYNQTSVFHTMERILGCAPAANQLYAMSPVMSSCFTDEADLAPFTALPAGVPIDEMNPKKSAASPAQQELYTLTARLNLTKPDACDEDTFNRVIWHSVRGEQTYPADAAGAHGKGLAALGLKLDPSGGVDEDDDDDGDGDGDAHD